MMESDKEHRGVCVIDVPTAEAPPKGLGPPFRTGTLHPVQDQEISGKQKGHYFPCNKILLLVSIEHTDTLALLWTKVI